MRQVRDRMNCGQAQVPLGQTKAPQPLEVAALAVDSCSSIDRQADASFPTTAQPRARYR
jgi:hypothetical protein